MIEKISVTNFKSHAHTEIELGRVTALVGPNGCGKSTVLQAANLLSQLMTHGWETVFTQENAFPNLVRYGCDSGSISLAGNVYNTKWEVKIVLFADQQLQPTAELHLGEDNETVLLNKSDPLQHYLPKPVAETLRHAAYYKAVLGALAAASYHPDVKPQIRSDGSGLASALAYLKTSEDEVFQEVENELRRIVPSVLRIRPARTQVTLKERKTFTVNGANFPYEEAREVVGDTLTFDTTSGKKIPASAMSEGTLLALGLLTLLHSPATAHLILLDDIEAGLHPLAQRRLMNMLKEFAKTQDRQILLSTHSPYIVDELEAKDIWVMATDKEGISHCKRLSDHPDIGYALSVLTTGEIWGAEGDEWVLDESLPTETETANV